MYKLQAPQNQYLRQPPYCFTYMWVSTQSRTFSGLTYMPAHALSLFELYIVLIHIVSFRSLRVFPPAIVLSFPLDDIINDSIIGTISSLYSVQEYKSFYFIFLTYRTNILMNCFWGSSKVLNL